jgi:WhiB family transcriptional regulator, redox-sensing transcriptional regulator
MTQQGHVTHGSSIKRMDGIKAPYFDGSQVCAQVDPELFFPDSSAEIQVNLRTVKPLCKSCEFQEACLEYALKHPELQGIWAGTTDNERRLIRRYKRKSA